MLPVLRPNLVSFAAIAAMFAFVASAEEPAATIHAGTDNAGQGPIDEGQQDPTLGNDETRNLIFDPTVGYPPFVDPASGNPAAQPHEAAGHGANAMQDGNQAGDLDVPQGDAPFSAEGDQGPGMAAEVSSETEAGSGKEAVGEAIEGIKASDFAIPDDVDGLEPYKLIRSLQFVQDSVVSGDHSAMEMQRFLLGVIDSRLRAADQKVFDDPRNVDAALIYAMSGGNPETLEILAVQDKFGNFDNEITTVLRAYLNGRAAKTQTELAEVVKIYRDTRIGPYLALVAANVAAGLNDPSALELFDWARLAAPGTLVEEAALRRSLFISARKDMVDEALKYAQLYARRFINSPYAGQYADLLVDLVVLNYGKVGDERLSAILSFMDRPRKREVYLRIARKAVITGLRDLAVFASGKAEELIGPEDRMPKALADLYSHMAKVPTDGVDMVLEDLNAVPERQLSSRDRALRTAAQIVAAEVVRKPGPDSLTQAFSPMVSEPNATEAGVDRPAEAQEQTQDEAPVLDQVTEMDDETKAAVEAFDGYVSDRKKTLERIDKLLEGIGEDQGS